jgi:hypothetical protein
VIEGVDDLDRRRAKADRAMSLLRDGLRG